MSASNYGQLTKEQLRVMADMLKQRMAPLSKFSVVHDEIAYYPPSPKFKEENVFITRFGERKPKHGQRVYRLWIDGKFAGDFKTKRERREFIEMTRTLMQEGP